MSLDYVEPSAPPPVDWVGQTFPEPLLYGGAALWFILFVAALAGMAMFRQRLMEERAIRRRAPELIFAAVRKTIDQALMKTGAETIGGGRRVAEALQQHLGPLISFSGALGGPLGKLKKALEGKADESAAHGGASHGHGHGESHGAPAQTALVVTANADQHLTIAPGKVVSDGPAPHHPPPPHKPAEMTAREQIIAVREALELLSESWRKEAVEGDLRKIQDALLIRSIPGGSPARPLRPLAPAPAPRAPSRRGPDAAPRKPTPKVL